MATALLIRLVLVAAAPRSILWPDGREMEAVARSVLDHHTYGMQTLRPPGYPTFVAAVYWVFGPDLVRLRVVEAVLGTVSVGIIAAGGTWLFGGQAGLLSAALAALNPILILLPSTQYSENILFLAMCLAYAAAFAAWRRGEPWRWALAGALFGLGLLIRPNTVTLLAGLAVGFALVLHRERRGWALPILTAGFAALLVVSPWIARNYRVHHHWFFVATGGGRQFWMGNNAGAQPAPYSITVPDSTLQAELTRLPDEMARERLLYQRGLEFIRTHPGRAAQLYLGKLGNLFALYPKTRFRSVFGNPWSHACQAAVSSIIFLGTLLALTRLRRTPPLWPMVCGIVAYALATAFFFTVMRYRIPFEPCLIWMAGLGWSGLLSPRKISP